MDAVAVLPGFLLAVLLAQVAARQHRHAGRRSGGVRPAAPARRCRRLLLADLPVDLTGLRQGSARPAYVHTDALAEHHLVRHAVAAALAGTTPGRALAGRDADGRGPEAVATLLAALVAQVDDPVSAPSALRPRATRAHGA
jgi:hypothetical protein